MFFLSWLTARGSGIGSQCLITLTLSPVNIKTQRHEGASRETPSKSNVQSTTVASLTCQNSLVHPECCRVYFEKAHVRWNLVTD